MNGKSFSGSFWRISLSLLTVVGVAMLAVASESGTMAVRLPASSPRIKAAMLGRPQGQPVPKKSPGTDGEIKIAQKALPGEPLESFTSAYGIPSVESGNTSTWRMKGMSITASKRRDGVVASVAIHMEKGATARTPDGIVLGKDTFRDVVEWARTNHVQLRERIESGDGIWLLKVYFVSKVRPEVVSIYLWTLPGSNAVDRQIDRGKLPLHSDRFLSITVGNYTAEMKTIPQYEQLEGGSSSVHE